LSLQSIYKLSVTNYLGRHVINAYYCCKKPTADKQAFTIAFGAVQSMVWRPKKISIMKKSIGSKIFYSSLLVGTLDILTALIKYYLTAGKNPLFIFKYIASGILGMDAFSGGTSIILIGLLLHYIIAMAFTALFYLLYIRITLLSKNKIITGVIYGIFIWLVMNLVIVPLSNTPKSPFNFSHALQEMIILIVMIGLPLSFLAHYFSQQNKQNR